MMLSVTCWLLSACGQLPVSSGSPLPPRLDVCVDRFARQNAGIERAQARDHGAALVPGFPWLRADRFIASFAAEPLAGERREQWVLRLSELDADARRIELEKSGGAVADFPRAQREACRALLNENLVEEEHRFNAMRQAVQPPRDYLTGWRLLGLYPLTSQLVLAGIARWHEDVHSTFATPLEQLPREGRLVRWTSRKPTAPGLLRQAADIEYDALGIPRISPQTLAGLFDHHAPVWEVDVADGNDLIGRPRSNNPPDVDPRDPVEYRLLTYTRWRGQVLMQLNYVVWFSARPGDDMYAGALDGLVWRVTLNGEGKPLIYDSIHNCGCYHKFFPAGEIRLREDLPSGSEPPLVPARQGTSRPLVVRLAAHTHYIQRIHALEGGPEARELRAASYRELRKSGLFGKHGLVEGSERPERFVLWPMGIRSPGAMRQMGRHATAFVGRRHFDDPFLFDRLFRLK